MAYYERDWTDGIVVERPPLLRGLAELAADLEQHATEKAEIADLEYLFASTDNLGLEREVLNLDTALKVVGVARQIMQRAQAQDETSFDVFTKALAASHNWGAPSESRAYMGFRRRGEFAITMTRGIAETASFQNRSFVISREGIARVLRQPAQPVVPDTLPIVDMMDFPQTDLLVRHKAPTTSSLQGNQLARNLQVYALAESAVLVPLA